MSFKKFLSCFAVAAMLCSMLCVGVSAQDAEGRVFDAPMIPDGYTIEIDGEMDDIWLACDPQEIDRVDLYGENNNLVKTSGTLRVMWDANGFYVYIEVDKTDDGWKVYNSTDEVYWYTAEYNNDCVRLGWITNGLNNWTSPGDSGYAYNGGATPLLDGSKNLGGWYYHYGQEDDVCNAVMKQEGDYKYTVEAFVSWIDPDRTDVYPYGVCEGNAFILDAAIFVTDGEGNRKGVVCWNADPYDNFSSGLGMGYVVLAEEADVSKLEEDEYDIGDCNGDGDIDTKDATLLLQYLAEWDVEDSIELDAADCNGDGDVDTKDATLLLQYLAEWDVTLG